MNYPHWLLGLLPASILFGCAPPLPALTPEGLHHAAYGYDVVYHDARTKSFLGELWRLDNFYKAGWSAELTLKSVGPYQTTLRFDTDDNGSPESSEITSTYDLRFAHRVTAGVIWLRGMPLSQFDRAKDLRVMMHDWITDLNGARLDFLQFDEGLQLSATNLAAIQTAEVPAKVAGREALAAVVDIANVEQIKLDPKARMRRCKIVMVRSGLSYHGPAGKDYPLLLVAALSDQPEYFGQHVAEFDRFLGQVVIAGKRGYEELVSVQHSEQPQPVDTAAPVSESSTSHAIPRVEPSTSSAPTTEPQQSNQ